MTRLASAFRAALCAALLAAATAANAPGWVLAWGDEFDEPAVNQSTWNVYANVSEGSNQIELYTADNVFVRDGSLVLRTRPQNVTIGHRRYNVTSGRVDTALKRNVSLSARARVEVRARLQNDAAFGVHSAHWLIGYECWPRGSEIDIMECQSPDGRYVSSGGAAPPGWQRATSNYHYGPACGADERHTTGVSSYPHAPMAANFSRDFTTFAVEANATALTYFVNDTIVNEVYAGMPGWSGAFLIPSWDTFLILSQAFMAHRPFGDPAPWAWPAEQHIDFVRVYKWAAGD